MASRSFKQEMPPPGGFAPIDWAKQIPKKGWSGFAQFGAFIGFTTASWLIYRHFEKKRRNDELEMLDAKIAIAPLMDAERQRLFLKQLRLNRDEEAELMKDVPGWEVGTLYGEPVYHNVRDQFIHPSTEGFFTHCSWHDKYKARYQKLYN